MRIGGLRETLEVTDRPIVLGPTVVSAAAARSAPASAVPPTFLQHDHLQAALIFPTESTYLGVVTYIPGVLDADALVAAVTGFVQAHDGLRTWFEPTGDGFVRHVLEPDGVELEAAELTEPTGGTEWTDALANYFATTITPFDWPGLSVAAIVRPAGFEVVFVADHAFSDGMSQALASLELTDRYAAALAGRVQERAISGDSSADYAIDERARADDALAEALFPLWDRELAQVGYRLPAAGIDLGIEHGTRHSRTIRSRTLLDAEQGRAFDAVLADLDASLSVALFAALALAQYELTAEERFWTLNVVATRCGNRFARAQGWFCNFVPLSFQVPPNASFTALVPVVRAALERNRTLARVPAHGAIGRLVASGREIATRDPGFVTVLDLRRPAAAAPETADTRLFSAEGVTSSLGIWLGRNATEYFLALGAPDAPATWERLSGYADRIQHVLAEIARTGDYRPVQRVRAQVYG
ncbi:condensation domain-containing protein [Nocardia alni]|uniref:condensation domain-containing protein n=1 Tax=Nocardia alni TaxID=2815723 RepID=UPI001C215F13|nr:condensation domain-containing protein [Nocardia alni]